MANNYIYIGSTSAPSHFFDNESLLSVHADVATAMIEDELKIDTLEFEVSYDDADETLRNLAYATPIYYYNGPNFMGTFYFKSVERYGDHYYRVEAVSVIGLLEYETFYGGYYTAKNVKDLMISAFLTDGLSDNVLIGYTGIETPSTPFDWDGVQLASAYSANNVTTNDTLIYEFSIHSFLGTREYAYLYYLSQNSGDIPNPGSSTGTMTWKNIEGEFYCGRPSASIDNPENKDLVFVFNIINRRLNGSTTVAYSAQTYFCANFNDRIRLEITPSSYTIGRYSINGGAFSYFDFTADSSGTTNRYKRADSSGRVCARNVTIPVESLIGVENSGTPGTYYGAPIEYVHMTIHSIGWWRNSLNDYVFRVGAVLNAMSGQASLLNIQKGYLVPVTDLKPVENIVVYDGITNTPVIFANQILNAIWVDNVDSIIVSGWIPTCTRREAVHKILFALNLNLIKTQDGNIIIGKLVDQVQGNIETDNIYDSGSIQKVNAPSEIALTEYAYSADLSSTVELFDNTDETVGSEQYVVVFSNAPIYGAPVATSGMTIHKYNSNAAIVSGKGKITGHVYRESRRDLVQKISNRADGGRVSVGSVQLITTLNASSVMDKLLAYYGGNVYKIKNSLIANGERTGAKYSFMSPFGEASEAFLNSYVLHNSSIAKTDCEFTAGFVPQDIGAQYNNFVILTGSGTWTVPSSVFTKTNQRIFVVLIGGGQGGESGYAGENGKTNTSLSSREVARGGMYGENGISGKVFTQEISNPSSSYSYSCGAGGSGGGLCSDTQTNNKGGDGGATTFDTMSSDSGTVLENGYTNLLNGEIYASNMPKWNSESGKGGDGEYVTVGSDRTFESIVRHPSTTVYNFMDGVTLEGFSEGWDIAWGNIVGSGSTTRQIAQIGGGVGGLALCLYGVLDEDIWPKAVTDTTGKQTRYVIGGVGATPTYVPPTPTVYNKHYYGYGGMGGPGGGGGGNGGAYEDRWSDTSPHVYSYPGGTGGKGGKGGDGGDGCVLIYY